jgi:prepilin-type N-terminal cleavage/methylation domain-containing protein
LYIKQDLKIKKAFTLIELLVVISIISLLMTIAVPTYDKMILKARADEAKATIQAIAFAQERYHQEVGEYYPNNTEQISNENNIHENLKVDLSISNNFLYTIEGDNGDSYIISAYLRHEDAWDECGSNSADGFDCKQDGTRKHNSWVEAYEDTISSGELSYHYLQFQYPELLEGDYVEEGISYENLHKDE